MQLRFVIDGTEGEFPIVPGDLMHFERQFDVTWTEVERRPKVEHVMFLGWRSAKRRGVTELDFDTWADTVEDFGAVPAVPLARRVNGSPRSRSSQGSRRKT